MSFRLVLLWLSLLVFSLTISVSCSPTIENKTPIVVGCSTRASWYPWEVTRQEKIFEKNGLNINFIWYDNYIDLITATIEGKLDANCQTLDETIIAAAKGSNQVIVLTASSSVGNDKIIAREGIQTVLDLKGETVAVEPGSVDHFLLLIGLRDVELSQQDVKLQPMAATTATEAFFNGSVSAVAVFAPHTTRALERPGSKELFSSEDYSGLITNHLVVSRKLINKKPQVVQALVNSWYETLQYIQAKPDKAYQIMAKRAGVPVQEYRSYDAGNKLLGIKENLRAFELQNDISSLPDKAKQISKFVLENSKFLLRNGSIKKPPDLNKLFEPRFLRAYAQLHR